MATSELSSRPDVYQLSTDQILEALDQGTVPWRKPWHAGSLPQNAVSKKAYRGINPFLLQLGGFSDHRWVSYKQAAELGGNIKKGAKSTMVTFWKQLQVEDHDTQKIKTIPLLRYYRVFNVEQCEGLTLPPTPEPTIIEPIVTAERIIDTMPNKPDINHDGGNSAFYSPSHDRISLPPKGTFTGNSEYYATTFHELVHSTGHKSRLDRHVLEGKAQHFGDDNYSKEELVAEFGSAFLCGESGIANTIENSTAYIASWKRVLKADKKLVVGAAGKAQAAANYILGKE